MRHELKQALSIAETFSRLLHPFAEVVLHDLKKDKIEAILNPISCRKVGDQSHFDQWNFDVGQEENVIGPYEKINFDGRRFKSISLILRDEKNKAVGFLCVNLDVSQFDHFSSAIDLFLGIGLSKQRPFQENIFKDDLNEQINMFIQSYCRDHHFNVDAMSRAQKQALVFNLAEKGAFKGKNATEYVARMLKISRATVYNYLKDKDVG